MGYKTTHLELLDGEATITRKFIKNFDAAQASFKPHEKNMTMGRLLGHIIEITDWVEITLAHSELNWATANFQQLTVVDGKSALSLFETKYEKAINAIHAVADDVFLESWTMRSGDNIMFTLPKVAVLRQFVFNHTVHHRAQLGMYYRLLDIPVPSSYGPSADAKM